MGGFRAIRHNEIRDLTGNLMSDVSHDVLWNQASNQSLERFSMVLEDGVRFDIAANCFGEAGTSWRTSTCLSLLQRDNRWLPAKKAREHQEKGL